MTITPTTGTLYTLKTWKEMGKAWNGSFSDIILYDSAHNSTGGITVLLELGKTEIDYVKKVNVNAGSFRTYNGWAHAPGGQIYLDKPDGNGGYLDANVVVRWNRIASSSGENDPLRNRICVSSIINGSGSIVGIPKSADYSQFEQYDWLNLKVYGMYGAVPLLFRMPLFDSTTGFPLSKGNNGMWIPVGWLHENLGAIQIPWANPVPPPPPPPSNGVVVRVAELGAGKWLSIRPDASVNNVPVGFFYPGTPLTIVEIKQVGADYWGKDRNGYYIALLLRGVYTTWRLP